MNPTVKMKIYILMPILALLIGASSTSAMAGYRSSRNYHTRLLDRPYHSRIFTPIRPVIIRPAVSVHVNNRFTQNDRLNIAMAYLKDNDYLSIKEYAKITGLSKRMAEAELDSFVMTSSRPIVMTLVDKNKVYSLRE